MSTLRASAPNPAATEPSALERALAEVRDKATEFARLPPLEKAALARECVHGLRAQAAAWVARGAERRDADPGEEWLAGPVPSIRLFRLFAESLEEIARHGRPSLGRGARRRRDGRLEVDLFPASTFDRLSFSGFTGYALMEPGVNEQQARERQAAFYQQRDPRGGVSVILGAGNVSSIPPMDVATKMFGEGFVCVLKMNPVNEWAGPFIEQALAPLISRGYLRVVYGGAEVGSALVYHPAVDDVHITGSDRTHDLIVWGPPGPERERRKAENDPLLRVPITSELGNVSPVAIVPYRYSDDELWFQARNVATMVTNNASFNCNAAKVLITPRGWPQREAFLTLIGKALAAVPPRRAYYPGAFDRYRLLLEGHEAERFGAGDAERLPWALVRGLDPTDRTERLFHTEPFCGILSETSLGSDDPVQFLGEAVAFMNHRLWGTLNAMLVVPPKLEADPTIAAALDRAVIDLRYGTVTFNHWPALVYASGTMPWGGYQGATLADIQSGLGWVHNPFMLAGIDKSVLRGPLVVRPTPLWFYDNTKAAAVGPKLADLEAAPSWFKIPGLLAAALL